MINYSYFKFFVIVLYFSSSVKSQFLLSLDIVITKEKFKKKEIDTFSRIFLLFSTNLIIERKVSKILDKIVNT